MGFLQVLVLSLFFSELQFSFTIGEDRKTYCWALFNGSANSKFPCCFKTTVACSGVTGMKVPWKLMERATNWFKARCCGLEYWCLQTSPFLCLPHLLWWLGWIRCTIFELSSSSSLGNLSFPLGAILFTWTWVQGSENGNYQQTKRAAALRQSSFLQRCLCQTHVKDRNNIHSNAVRANSFRRRRVEVFTTGLSCRTMSYSKQEVGGIFLWLKHTEAPSPVLSMEKATQSPIWGAGSPSLSTCTHSQFYPKPLLSHFSPRKLPLTPNSNFEEHLN